jgi:hypothetical protein
MNHRWMSAVEGSMFHARFQGTTFLSWVTGGTVWNCCATCHESLWVGIQSLHFPADLDEMLVGNGDTRWGLSAKWGWHTSSRRVYPRLRADGYRILLGGQCSSLSVLLAGCPFSHWQVQWADWSFTLIFWDSLLIKDWSGCMFRVKVFVGWCAVCVLGSKCCNSPSGCIVTEHSCYLFDCFWQTLTWCCSSITVRDRF